MMFRLDQPENPLDLLVSHAGSTAVQRQMQNQEQARKNKEISEGLSKINDQSSPLEVLQAINSLKIPEEDKSRISKAYETTYKYRTEGMKKQQQRQDIDSLARSADLDPQAIPEGTSYQSAVKMIDNLKKKKQSQEKGKESELVTQELEEITNDPDLTKQSPIEIYNKVVGKFGPTRAKEIADLASKSKPKLSDPAEKRRQKSSVQSSYKSLEDQVKEDIREELNPKKESALRQRLKDIRMARARDNELIENGKAPKHYYEMYNEVFGEKLTDREPVTEKEVPKLTKESNKQKIKFDKSNPEHIKRRQQVLEQVSGDRAKANIILAEEFTT